jgi:TRAP-type C4-dicarboxylate transport system substrate-binding protein
MTKIREHGELKELYQKLTEEDKKLIEDILPQKIEDYHKKVKSYLMELLEEIKACRETYENLHEGTQKQEVKQDWRTYRRTYTALWRRYWSYFTTLEP